MRCFIDRDEKIAKSETARRKRKIVKEIKENVLDNYYSKMRHKRQKLKKLKQRHHDHKI